jgi:aspartyl-tRNA(Asn)/glutamyl-tRNA(Gln) amidotransferase subunit B
VAEYLGGKEAILRFLVGQVMKATRGKANPQLVTKLLQEKLH